VLRLGESTVATWLQDEGYRTVLIGKYLNGYYGTRVPVGWDDWYAIAGDYQSNKLNENGQIVNYNPERYHLDDVLAEKSTDYVRATTADDTPFFMWLGTKAPHAPATPAARHEDAFLGARLLRPPSFNEKDVSDKPNWVRNNSTLDQKQIAPMEDLYRDRLRSMLAVDEMVERLVDALRERGELDNTYLVFTSDNGFHLGQHRLTTGKWTAYEEDIRVPDRARPRSTRRPHASAPGAKQRPGAHLRRSGRGQDAVLRGRAIARAAALDRADTRGGVAASLSGGGRRLGGPGATITPRRLRLYQAAADR